MTASSRSLTRATHGWLSSLDRLFAVPPGYRNESIDRVTALEMLRCGEDVLDELVANGLPHGGDPGLERFDRHDLVNLSLYSGSGNSVPEETMRYALRWMGEPEHGWLTTKRWEFSVELSCPEPGTCRAPRRWALARPVPEHNGGWVESLQAHSTPAPPPGLSGVDIESAGATLAAQGVLVTRGERRELRSARLEEIARQFSTGDFRWARLPEALQWEPGPILDRGIAPCISACLEMERQCRAAGFEARTRRGWIMGMLDLAHSWLEVVDEDGELKMIDPAFAILARDHAEAPNPAFVEACFGSVLNRLMPTEHLATQPLMTHVCGGTTKVPATRTKIQLATPDSNPEDAGRPRSAIRTPAPGSENP